MKISQLAYLLLTLSFSLSHASIFNIFQTNPQASAFTSCLINSYSTNGTSQIPISQLTFTPSNSSFLPIWRFSANNLRFVKPSTPKPSVIVTPLDASHIQTALQCAKKHEYELRVRCGGHDFEGLSYTAEVPFVMIDLIRMRSIDVDVAARTAWVQAGATVGELYYAVSQKTDTLFFTGGVTPAVGVSGFVSGGGYGNLMRKYGLAADNLLDVRFMDVNGDILDRNSMGEDLFWAIRGGGASNFGIVLAWKLRLVEVPPKVTYFAVNKTLEQNATFIFHKYQYVAPFIDNNLLIRVQIFGQNITNTTEKTILMLFEGIYQGETDTLIPIMDEKFPELGVTREICQELKMVESSLVFGGFPSTAPTSTLANRTAAAKRSDKGKSDYVRTPIPISGLEAIWRKIMENDGSELVAINAFGGKMAEISETEIPYPHRAGTLYQILEYVQLTDQSSDTTPTSIRRLNWLRSFNKFLEPYVSKNPREAYLNYNDLELGVANGSYEEASEWGERYWKRDNFKKLIRVKAQVDPSNFFRHPQSVPVFSSPKNTGHKMICGALCES